MFITGYPTLHTGQVSLTDSDWTIIVPFRSSSGRRYFRNNASSALIYIRSTDPVTGAAPIASDAATTGFPIPAGDRLEHVHKGIVYGRVAASGGNQTVSFADYVE